MSGSYQQPGPYPQQQAPGPYYYQQPTQGTYIPQQVWNLLLFEDLLLKIEIDRLQRIVARGDEWEGIVGDFLDEADSVLGERDRY